MAQPGKNSRVFECTFSTALHKRIRATARKDGVSMAELIRSAVLRHLSLPGDARRRNGVASPGEPEPTLIVDAE